jgi:hypothetical protein
VTALAGGGEMMPNPDRQYIQGGLIGPDAGAPGLPPVVAPAPNPAAGGATWGWTAPYSSPITPTGAGNPLPDPLVPGQVNPDAPFVDSPGKSIGAQILAAVAAHAAQGLPFDTAFSEGLWRRAGLDPNGAAVAHLYARGWQASHGPLTEQQINELVGSIRSTGKPPAPPAGVTPIPVPPVGTRPLPPTTPAVMPPVPAAIPAKPEVPLPWKQSPIWWNSLTAGGQGLAKGAFGEAGHNADDYVELMKRSFPQGSSLGGGQVQRATNPRTGWGNFF